MSGVESGHQSEGLVHGEVFPGERFESDVAIGYGRVGDFDSLPLLPPRTSGNAAERLSSSGEANSLMTSVGKAQSGPDRK